jgi:DNA-binding transcriptional ArsR family regulator
MADRLSTLYHDLLDGTYDCVDRIVLNGYFRPGHDPGGFRVWWRRLTGSDATLDNAHLMRLAGRFSRRVRAYAKANRIPVIDCSVTGRKHDIAEKQLETTTVTEGVFLILVGKAQAPVWDVSGKHHLERKRPLPYVNHYSFHILDREWGHLTMKLSGHPPFPAQVILNGHEWVACHARKAGIQFRKEGNCFTHIADLAGFARIADTLSDERTIGRLREACERWIYSACLCFALDLDEQHRSVFRYQYSNYQLEYSRNLVFTVGGRMDQVFQALIDRTRRRMDLRTVKTILGYQRRPRYRPRRGKQEPIWEVTVERPVYDLTIFKLHGGRLTLKIYTKGERVLRMEAMAHNTQTLGRRALAEFPALVTELKAILERFVDALACIDRCFIGGELLDTLPLPSQVGRTTVGGIDLNKPRMRWVAEAVIALAISPRGFLASDLAQQVQRLGGRAASSYTPRRAAYDLKKLRGKGLVDRIQGTRRYEAGASGLKTLATVTVLRTHVVKPLLAAAHHSPRTRGAHHPSPLDRHYEALRTDMHSLFSELGIAA